MDAKLNSGKMDEKMDDGKSSLMTVPESSTVGQTESFTEVTILSEQISTEDTELSLTDISFNVFPDKTPAAPAELDLPTGEMIGAVSACGPTSAQKQQPRPLFALLPSPMEPCTVYEMNQSFASISRSQKSFKTDTIQTEASEGEDLCASVLLACLFCHPLDCFLATMRGCNACLWSLCSSLCGCEPTVLQSPLDLTYCDLCGCLGVGCVLCDCSACEICLPFTECLDLAMEISQMLYH